MEYDPRDCTSHFWEPDGLWAWDLDFTLAQRMHKCPWCGTEDKIEKKEGEIN